jgi:YD repeat-containing protein
LLADAVHGSVSPGHHQANGSGSDHEVEHGRSQNGSGEACQLYQIEACHQYANRSAKTVREVQQGKLPAWSQGLQPEDTRAHEWEGHSQQHGLGKDQRAGNRPFDRDQSPRARQGRVDGVIGPPGGRLKDIVEDQPDAADHHLDRHISIEGLFQPGRPTTHHDGPGRHASQEYDQHDDLGIRIMTDE